VRAHIPSKTSTPPRATPTGTRLILASASPPPVVWVPGPGILQSLGTPLTYGLSPTTFDIPLSFKTYTTNSIVFSFFIIFLIIIFLCFKIFNIHSTSPFFTPNLLIHLGRVWGHNPAHFQKQAPRRTKPAQRGSTRS